jgi:hypothetical protein
MARIDGARLLDQAYHDALLLLDRDTPLPASGIQESLQPPGWHRSLVIARRSVRTAALGMFPLLIDFATPSSIV